VKATIGRRKSETSNRNMITHLVILSRAKDPGLDLWAASSLALRTPAVTRRVSKLTAHPTQTD
jgi:hypothetical protein